MSDKNKQYRQTYYKEYYKNNLDIYTQRNKNRPSQRQNYVGIEINGKTYCFPSKASVNWKKIHKNDINEDCLLVS